MGDLPLSEAHIKRGSIEMDGYTATATTSMLGSGRPSSCRGWQNDTARPHPPSPNDPTITMGGRGAGLKANAHTAVRKCLFVLLFLEHLVPPKSDEIQQTGDRWWPEISGLIDGVHSLIHRPLSTPDGALLLPDRALISHKALKLQGAIYRVCHTESEELLAKYFRFILTHILTVQKGYISLHTLTHW